MSIVLLLFKAVCNLVSQSKLKLPDKNGINKSKKIKVKFQSHSKCRNNNSTSSRINDVV